MTLEDPVETSPSRGMLLQRFRDLHEYLSLLGEHINLIHTNLNQIEKNLDEMRSEQKSTIESTTTELEQIKRLMVTKTEVEGLLQELNDVIKGAFPLLTIISE